MNNNLTWEDVLKRTDIIGGDIHIDDGGYIFRGPISGIKLEKGHIYIDVSWMARIEISRMSIGLGKGWESCNMSFYRVSVSTLPTDIGNGRISLGVSSKEFSILFPKGDKKLDPAHVKGLKI